MRVPTNRDSQGRIDQLRIFKDSRVKPSIFCQFIYGTDGFLNDIEFTGKKEDMPDVPTIIELINEKFMERLGTIGLIDEITRIRKISNIDIYGQMRASGFFNDRLTWAAITDETEKLEILEQMYRGRAGHKTCWWDSDVSKLPENWTPPITEIGKWYAGTADAAFGNVIHLRNSKDGVNVDMIYMAPQVQPHHSWIMRIEMVCPLLADLPVGANNVVIGFEVPSQGGTTIYTLSIEKTKVTILARLAHRDGSMSVVQSEDISSWVATGTKQEFHFILEPPYFHLVGNIGVGSNIVSIKVPSVPFYPMVVPFWANECETVVVSGVYLGEIAAWYIIKPEYSQFPAIYNETMTLANTEYSKVLPIDTKRFSIKTRDGTAFRLAFVTGKVATPTEPYETVPANAEYYEDALNISDLTLYFACASAAKVVEIVAWS